MSSVRARSAADHGLPRRTAGLFGGTFDPVHQGHLDAARYVTDRCGLDSLLFVPAPQPPHKPRPVASFEHRVAMIEAALAEQGDARMGCSTVERDLPRPSYTINTVEALIRQNGDVRYFLIIGADSLVDLPRWYRGEELLHLISLIVVHRDGMDAAAIEAVRASSLFASAFRFDPLRERWEGPDGRSVTYLAGIDLPVSSSSIRADLAAGHCPAMLPGAVLAYIRRHRLYGWEEDA